MKVSVLHTVLESFFVRRGNNSVPQRVPVGCIVDVCCFSIFTCCYVKKKMTVKRYFQAYGSFTLHGTGKGTGNDGFLHYAMYCTHYTRTGTVTGNHCFL